ncbi:MAG: hypothetical protein ACYCWN_12150, partial [Ferrimicrobium sp.]
VILSDHQVALGSLVLDSVLGWVGLSVWTWRARSLVLGRVVLSARGANRSTSVHSRHQCTVGNPGVQANDLAGRSL